MQGGEDARHMLQEQLARTCQPRAAAGADEQQLTQVFFEFLDDARQRRLLDMQPLNSAAAMNKGVYWNARRNVEAGEWRMEMSLRSELLDTFWIAQNNRSTT